MTGIAEAAGRHVPELSALLARSVGDAVPYLRRRHLSYTFEDHDCGWRPDGDWDTVERSLHRLLRAAGGLVVGGVVSVHASAAGERSSGCLLRLRVGGSGRCCSAQQMAQTLDELGLSADAGSERPDGQPPQLAWLRRASGRCPATGIELRFSALPPAGFVFDLSYPLRASRPPSTGPADGPAVQVWVVHPEPVAAASVLRGAERAGWHVRWLQTLADLHRRLRQPMSRPPDLLLLFGADALSFAELVALREALPAAVRCVLAVDRGSLWLATPQVLPGVEVICHPFASADWRRWRDPLARSTPRMVDGVDRRPVLVVDDEEVNRLLAQAMLERLGHSVCSAADGAEAVQACQQMAPALVLMDLQMPSLDGWAATRQLRDLQRAGAVVPFAIVATSAAVDVVSVQASIDADIDAFLPKPLRLEGLAAELRRWGLAAAPTSAAGVSRELAQS